MNCAWLLLSLAPGLPGEAGSGTVELDYKTYRKWTLQLPAEQFAPISGGIPVAHAGGESFLAEAEGIGLRVDTDGDGELDVTIEGKTNDVGETWAAVTLRGTSEDGAELTYSARLLDKGKGWHYAASGAMVGKLGNTKIQLIDQNGNGRYDDFGEDAMLVGRGKNAWFLSPVISVAGELYEIDVAADGTSISYSPYEGETGTLDLVTELETQGKLQSVIVRSEDGRYSFECAKASKGQRVPAGTYELHSAQFGLDKARALVSAGRMDSMDVPAGATVALAWGGPLEAEFKYRRAAEELTISPTDVRYFGKAGEQYHLWDPVGKSPEFTIKEIRAGTEVAKATFPGTC